MMDLKEKNIEKLLEENQNISVIQFPPFCESKYSVLKDSLTGEKLYIHVNADGIIDDVTENREKAVDRVTEDKNIRSILFSK